jgi:mono/diheme cytochrome c family protein
MMRYRPRVLSAFLAPSALYVAVTAQAPTTGDANSGKRLFEKVGCYECHGYAGQGGRDGARIAATSMPNQSFIRYVRRPFGAMPAYSQKVLSDQEVLDIYAYVKAMPAAKPASGIPLLNQLRDK